MSDDKGHGFDSDIAQFPFLDGDVSHANLAMCLYTSQSIHFLRDRFVSDFDNRNTLLTVLLLKQGYWYHKLRKYFLGFIAVIMN